MKIGFIILALVAMAPIALGAQEADLSRRGRPATPADSLAPTIEAAEARAKLPVGLVLAAVSMHPADADFVAAAVGTPDRRCVEAGSGGRFRSGDFVAAMPDYAAYWAQGGVKVVWISVRPETPRVPLVVKATRLDAAAEGRVYGVDIPNAPRYPSGVYLPQAGRWMMVATAGGAWGCFVVTVK
jgi:hypothetical protein